MTDMPMYIGRIDRSSLPPSCTSSWDTVAGITGILISFSLIGFFRDIDTTHFSAALVTVVSIILIFIESFRSPALSMTAPRWHAGLIRNSLIKCFGIMLVFCFLLFLYWALTEYNSKFYRPFFDLLKNIYPFIISIIVIYIFICEWRLPYLADGALYVGLLTLGRFQEIDWKVLFDYVRGWLIKGFFLPLSFCSLCIFVSAMQNVCSRNIYELDNLFIFLYYGNLVVEMTFVVSGYIWACRLIDTHIRYTDYSPIGWIAALICYPPFLTILLDFYLVYQIGQGWRSSLLPEDGIVAVLWGSVIILLMVFHTWSDTCFGLRFSNLTNRGIITHGPYRLSKHPAYLTKNIRWWMTWVPFVASDNWVENVRLSLLLLGVNLIYVLRAVCEERMLSRDQTYVTYALWIDEHGMLRHLGQWLPCLNYRWRLERWYK